MKLLPLLFDLQKFSDLKTELGNALIKRTPPMYIHSWNEFIHRKLSRINWYLVFFEALNLPVSIWKDTFLPLPKMTARAITKVLRMII